MAEIRVVRDGAPVGRHHLRELGRPRPELRREGLFEDVKHDADGRRGPRRRAEHRRKRAVARDDDLGPELELSGPVLVGHDHLDALARDLEAPILRLRVREELLERGKATLGRFEHLRDEIFR